MAGQEFPPLEESAVAVKDAIRALVATVGIHEGVGISQLPFDVMALLTDNAARDETRTALWTVGLPLFEQHVRGIAVAAEQLEDTLIRAMTEIDMTSWAGIWKEMATGAGASADITNYNLKCICTSLKPLNATLEAMTLSGRAGLDGVGGTVTSLESALVAALAGMELKTELDLEEPFKDLIAGIKEALKDQTTATPHAGAQFNKTLAGTQVEAQIAAVEKMLSGEGGGNPSLLSWFREGINTAVGWGANLIEPVVRTIEGLLPSNPSGQLPPPIPGAADLARCFTGTYNWLTRGGLATPDSVYSRVAQAYIMASGLGVVAHGISALASCDILGCVDVNLRGLAAFIGTLAGFQPLAQAVSGTMYKNYIRVPLNYETNRYSRPYLPSIGDLIRFKFKRIFNRHPDDPVQTPAPLTFAEGMAYYGYSDEWIKVYEDDLYREPMARDLLLMAEVGGASDEWWTYKIRRLGYSDTDAPIMVDAFKRRAARTYITGLMRAGQNLYRKGFIDEDAFRELAAQTKMPDLAIDYAAWQAEAEARLDTRQELLTFAKTRYTRSVLTDEEFRDVLDQVFEDPKRARRVYQIERLKRYRAVYYSRPDELARAALPLYKRAFLAGLKTASEYKAGLIAAGMEPDMADLTLDLESEARDRAVYARFRAFGLPALRDAYLHGFVTDAQYRDELKDRGFPDEYLRAEADLMAVLLRRRIEGEVRAMELPHYRRGYVIGLVTAGALRAIFEEAGVSRGVVDTEFMTLDWQRAELERRRTEKAAADRARAEAQSKREADMARKLAQRAAEEARRETERVQREAETAAAEAERAIADELKAAAAARRPGWPADVDRVRKKLGSYYKAHDSILPDDVWSLSLALQDELRAAAAPDPIKVDTLIGRIEQALAAHAGVIPTPPAEPVAA